METNGKPYDNFIFTVSDKKSKKKWKDWYYVRVFQTQVKDFKRRSEKWNIWF